MLTGRTHPKPRGTVSIQPRIVAGKKKATKPFSEDNHPRAPDGKFTSESSGTKKKNPRSYGAAKPVKPAKPVGRSAGTNPMEKHGLLSSAKAANKQAKGRAKAASQVGVELAKQQRKGGAMVHQPKPKMPSMPMAGVAKSPHLNLVELAGRAGRGVARVTKAVEHKDYKTLAGVAGRNAARVAHAAGVAGKRAVQDTVTMGYIGKAMGEVAGAGLLGLAKKAGNALKGKKKRAF